MGDVRFLHYRLGIKVSLLAWRDCLPSSGLTEMISSVWLADGLTKMPEAQLQPPLSREQPSVGHNGDFGLRDSI